MPEGAFWLLVTGEEPSAEEVKGMTEAPQGEGSGRGAERDVERLVVCFRHFVAGRLNDNGRVIKC